MSPATPLADSWEVLDAAQQRDAADKRRLHGRFARFINAPLAVDPGVLRAMMGLRGWFRRVRKTEAQTKGLSEWFRVAFDSERVRLDVAPPGRDAWTAQFPWDSVQRICFKAEGFEASDGVYVFTALRPESYVIPVEARGGAEFWTEVIRRGLFDAELAIDAATAPDGLFCWPPA